MRHITYVHYAHFSSFLARVIEAVCLNSTCYSFHSFRWGHTTFTFEAQVPPELIKVHGNWRSDCHLLYPEMTDRQRRAAATHMATTISHIPVQFSCRVLTFLLSIIMYSLSTTYYSYFKFRNHSQPHTTMFGPWWFCLLTSCQHLVLLVNKPFCPHIVVSLWYYSNCTRITRGDDC